MTFSETGAAITFDDCPRERSTWSLFCVAVPLAVTNAVGLFVAMNYRLKGLSPLLNALALVWTPWSSSSGRPGTCAKSSTFV